MKGIAKILAFVAVGFALEFIFDTTDARVRIMFISVIFLSFMVDSMSRHFDDKHTDLNNELSEIKENLASIRDAMKDNQELLERRVQKVSSDINWISWHTGTDEARGLELAKEKAALDAKLKTITDVKDQPGQ